MKQTINRRFKESHLHNLSIYFIFLLFTIMPVADLITVLAREHSYFLLERISLIYRAFLILFFLVICTASITKKNLLIFTTFIISLSLIITIHIFKNYSNEDLFENILLLFKFFIFFIFFIGFKYIIAYSNSKKNTLYNIANFVIVAYILSIIIGALFNIELFKYYENERWGFKGFIISGNEASAFLLVSLAWFLYNKITLLNILCILLSTFAIILSGTKASIIGFFMITLGALWAKNYIKFIYRGSFFISIFLFMSFIFYKYNNRIQNEFDNTISYFDYQFYYIAKGSLVTLALSGRDIKLNIIYSTIFENGIWSIVFGGYPIARYMVEMDFFDIIALMGVPGAIVYFFFWFSCWKNDTRKPDFYHNRLKYIFLLTFVSLAFLGGHMFYSAVASPFAALLAIRFSQSTTYSAVKS